MAKSKKEQELGADEMLKKHGVSVLYQTVDGHHFFSAHAAQTHANTLENKKVNEIRKTVKEDE